MAVVDHGSVNRAAAALYLAQPSLSQAVRALERDLGQELFHRVGRRLVLTDAGRALIAPARDVLRGLAIARSSVASVESLAVGRVEIASMPSQAVEPLSGLIRRFAEAHPGLQVTVRAAFTPPDVVEMVRTGVTELGLLGGSSLGTAKDVELTPMGRQRFVVIAPPGSPFPRTVTWRDLRGQRMIVGQVGTGMRRLVDESGVDVFDVVESEHREAILPLVLGGVGMAVLTESWAELAARAGAVVHDLEPAAYLHVALACRRGRCSPAAEAFKKLIG
ncbi:LysR substrate-binding domain-containing protein [Kibdelosporangium lantanae]